MKTLKNATRRTVASGLAVVALGVGAAMAEVDEVVVTGIHEKNLFARGDHVTVRADARADFFVMGWKVDVDSTVGGDMNVFAGQLSVDGTTAGEVILAGGNVATKGTMNDAAVFLGGRIHAGGTIQGPLLMAGGRIENDATILSGAKILAGKYRGRPQMGGDLHVVAGRVELSKETVIRGETQLVAGDVELDGRFEGDVRVMARHAEIAGEVMGDLYVDAAEIEIERTAIIHGKFIYQSPEEADIHSNARIDGDVDFARSERPKRYVGMWLALAGMVALAVIGGLILLGGVATALVPRMFPAAADRVVHTPWRSLGIGAAVVIGTPLAILLVKLTIIGLPLSICLTAAYVLLLPIGLLAATYWAGRSGLRLARVADSDSLPRRLGIVALGVVILAVIGLIPVVGVIVCFVALLLGTGALIVESRNACKAGRTCIA